MTQETIQADEKTSLQQRIQHLEWLIEQKDEQFAKLQSHSDSAERRQKEVISKLLPVFAQLIDSRLKLKHGGSQFIARMAEATAKKIPISCTT